jgi:hypothetical protein
LDKQTNVKDIFCNITLSYRKEREKIFLDENLIYSVLQVSLQKFWYHKFKKVYRQGFLHKSFDVSSSFFKNISYRSVVGHKKEL